jgi:hypothetical protein
VPSVTRHNETIEFVGKISRDKYERIREIFPIHGFNTFVINNLIDHLLDVYDQDPKIVDVIADGVKKMLREGRT